MKVTLKNIGGIEVKNNDTYRLTDNRLLPNLVLSKTELHVGKCTSGHQHDGLDEVYVFMQGTGYILVGPNKYDVEPGSVILIKGGEFHKVYNTGFEVLEFNCVFQSYARQ